MATLRDPSNISPVVDGEVLVSFADDPKVGKDGSFNDDWYTLGILNDGSQVALNRTIEKNKTSGWGFGVVAVDTRPGELTATAETLEDNYATRRIAWPSRSEGVTPSKRVDGGTILYHDEVVARPFVAMVQRQQDGKMKITASRERAIATMENIGFGQEVTGREVSFDFQSGQNKDVFDELILEGVQAERKLGEDIIRFIEDAAGAASANVRLIFPANVSGGTWSLTVGDKPAISNLAHDVTASTLKGEIEKLDGVTNVTVTGSVSAGLVVKLTGASRVTADGSGLTGGDSTDIVVNPL